MREMGLLQIQRFEFHHKNNGLNQFFPLKLVEKEKFPAWTGKTKAAFPGAQLRHGRGHDGADRALIENFDIDHAAKRFDAVVIGSGDHAFIDVAYRARQRGLKVVVVSRPASLSRALATYADLVIDVPEFEFAA